MNENEIKKYNHFFPDYASELDVELWCYRNDITPERGGLGKVAHLRNAISILFPEKDSRGRDVFIRHEWFERRLEAWCYNQRMTWWGPAASAKSTDAAMLALVDWYAAPLETTTIICSTTLKMLKRRIFGEAVRFHSLHKGTPGQYLKSKTAIVLDADNVEQQIEKAGIFGFAVQQGDRKQAKDDIIGQHNRRIRLLVDEAQHPSLEVAFESMANLMKGCEDFKLVAFGNPDSRLDPLGRYSQPVTGWESISVEDECWDTKIGKCFYFDGLKSPAIKNPEKYHFLISKKDIEITIEDQGDDSPDYWQFCRGFVRPEGSPLQVISETFAIQNHMTESPEWLSGYEMGAGLDPSYSSGGDKCMLVPFMAGMSTWGLKVIAFMAPIQIHIEVSKLQEATFTRQLTEKVIEHCAAIGVPKKNFGMDTTGAQNILADVIDESWDEEARIYRCEFGGKASDLAASENNPELACDVYANRVTELWFNMVSFGRSNQIRKLPLEALKQFSTRQLLTGIEKRMRTVKRQIEPKSSMKERTGGRSPDTADACCVGLDVARQRMAIHPMKAPKARKVVTEDQEAIDYDVDGRDDLYLTNDIAV